MGCISVSDVITKFFNVTYNKLLENKEIPPLRFIFSDKLEENDSIVFSCLLLNISYLKENYVHDGEYSIIVDNPELFFNKLTELINLYADVNMSYKNYKRREYFLNDFINSALWIRMTPYDFYNIYEFLDRQISFLKSDNHFDDIKFSGESFDKENIIDSYYGYNVCAMKEINNIWMETYHKMKFRITDDNFDKSYNLPSIHYGIDNNTCYIYAIQNEKEGNGNKEINRLLFKLNSGIVNPNIHPSFVLALKTFIDLLKKENITSIKVPLLEVLNYEYHILLGIDAKQRFDKYWSPEYVFDKTDEAEYELYLEEKEWVDRTYNKEDFISKAKVENLANLFIRIQEQVDDIDIEIEPYMLNIKLKNKVHKM